MIMKDPAHLACKSPATALPASSVLPPDTPGVDSRNSFPSCFFLEGEMVAFVSEAVTTSSLTCLPGLCQLPGTLGAAPSGLDS